MANEERDGARNRLAKCWRILHMMTTSYGSHPTGQVLIGLTLSVLHRHSYAPTSKEICAATGSPAATVSRYVNWQLKHGLLEEIIDPENRRLRRLHQTEKGLAEMRWLDKQLELVWDQISELQETVAGMTRNSDPQKIVQQMAERTALQQKRTMQ